MAVHLGEVHEARLARNEPLHVRCLSPPRTVLAFEARLPVRRRGAPCARTLVVFKGAAAPLRLRPGRWSPARHKIPYRWQSTGRRPVFYLPSGILVILHVGIPAYTSRPPLPTAAPGSARFPSLVRPRPCHPHVLDIRIRPNATRSALRSPASFCARCQRPASIDHRGLASRSLPLWDLPAALSSPRPPRGIPTAFRGGSLARSLGGAGQSHRMRSGHSGAWLDGVRVCRTTAPSSARGRVASRGRRRVSPSPSIHLPSICTAHALRR
ncbi:hypothetical protein AURDEDRAFT_143009 [Auricularia subglabra TFB-10046 SS5]|nr:hypothetical protein AURDEDRAFT_143009 [Auricularia subglabra TFB-10046 SS5]